MIFKNATGVCDPFTAGSATQNRLVQMLVTMFVPSKQFILLIGLFWGLTSTAFAQLDPPCTVIDNCGNLQIQIAKQANNVGGCSEICGGSHSFHQLPYFVYLKYTPTGTLNLDPFKLDYEMLNIDLKLEISDPVKGGRSRISMKNTKMCFADQQLYSDAVLQTDAESTTIEFNLANNETGNGYCNATGQQVLFRYGYINTTLSSPDYGKFVPSTTPCANCSYYAALFPVIVDAYPGEMIRLACDYSLGTSPNFYQSKSVKPTTGNPYTCDIDCLNSGSEITTVSLPTGYSGTTNESLELRLNGIGGAGGKIRLFNTSQQTKNINYLEFVLTASSVQNFSKPTCTAINGFLPEITGSGNLYFLHYKMQLGSPITIAANSMVEFGEITIGAPEPLNAEWTVTLAAIDLDKCRVETATGNCTQLQINAAYQEVIYTSPSGTPVCAADPSNIVFKIQGVSQSDCKLSIRAGFSSSLAFQGFTIDEFVLKMKLINAQGLKDPVVDYANSGGWHCPSTSNCQTGTSGECIHYDTLTQELEMCIMGITVLSLSPDAMFTINFTTIPGAMPCIEGVIVDELSVHYQTASVSCAPLLQKSGFPVCGELSLVGALKTEGNLFLEDAKINFIPGCTNGCSINSAVSYGTEIQSTGYNYAACRCPECSIITVVPFDDDNPINGVSTFDLVLISKHLLGLEPLTDPYKLIAADVNKSKSITTFDIVETRKLILGIYTKFPDNNSWRFVDASFSFPNPESPFDNPAFPESKILTNSSSGVANFVAVKVGDINGNAIANNNKPAPLPETTLSCSPQGTAATGNTILIPVRYTGTDALEAVQVGLRFDPAQLRFIAPVLGDVPGFTSDAFNLTQADEGIIKAVWVLWDGAPQVNPGDILFYLSFEVKSPLPENSADWVQLDDALLQNRAWRSDDTEYALIKETTAADANAAPVASTTAVSNEAFTVNCFPNPGSAAAQFQVQSRESGKVRLSLNDASGHRLLIRELNFSTPGEQTFSLAGSEALPAGVYIWRVWNRSQKLQGHWVKQ